MRRNRAKNMIILISSILFCLPFALNAAEGENYLEMLKSPIFKTRVDALKAIERSASGNDEIFEYIAANLMSNYLEKNDDRNHIDEMAWHCKALASSGDEKYLPALQKVVDQVENGKLKKYCSSSIANFDELIQKRQTLMQPPIEGYSEEMSRTIHMLQSRDYRLMNDAVKRIMSSNESDEKVYDILSEVLLEEAPNVKIDQTDPSTYHNMSKINTLSNMAKCLGNSGIGKYVLVLDKVHESADSTTLKKHARQAKEQLEEKTGSAVKE